MQSHGGRVRSLVTGENQIDIAFIGAPTCDDYGNCRGIGGKSDCGVLSYARWTHYMRTKWLQLQTAWFHFRTSRLILV